MEGLLADVPRVAFANLAVATRDWSARLGEGATGEVFAGRLSPLGTGGVAVPVAVKRLRVPRGNADRAGLWRAFRAEVEALRGLEHANVVRLLACSLDDGPAAGAALIFELLEGGSLAARLRRPRGAGMVVAVAAAAPAPPPLSPAARLDIAIDVARGLAYLHGQLEPGDATGAAPVLHRDVKAANIGLTRDGVAKLLDCGLARALRGGAGVDGAAPALHTLTGGALVGTPGYAAPEVARGRYGVASEVYSLGVVLLELLTGACVDADTVADVRDAVEDAGGDAAPLRTRADAGWPPAAVAPLAALVLECTAPRPERRPPNARAVIARLAALRPALAAPPLRDCVVCLEGFPEAQGVLCGGGGGGGGGSGGGPHFLCHDCLRRHIAAELGDRTKLRRHRGVVVCPAGDNRAPGAGGRCTAAPWAFRDLQPHLDAATQAEWVASLTGALGALLESETRAEAAAQPAVAGATADAAPAYRVAAHRAAIAAAHVNLHCPHCGGVFVDYDGCDAVECGHCGGSFCGLCLASCASSAAAHAHVTAANHHGAADGVARGVYGGMELFRRFHAARRAAAVGDALRGVAADVRGAVFAALRRDLADVSVDVRDVARRAGVAVGAPPPTGAAEGGARGGRGGGGGTRPGGAGGVVGGVWAPAAPAPARAAGRFATTVAQRGATDCLHGAACAGVAPGAGGGACPYRHRQLGDGAASRVYCADWCVWRGAAADGPFCPRGAACGFAHPHRRIVALTDCPACRDGGGTAVPAGAAGAGAGAPWPAPAALACRYTGGLPCALRHGAARAAPRAWPPPLCDEWGLPGVRCPAARDCGGLHVMDVERPGDGGYRLGPQPG